MRSYWEIIGQAIREARQETEESQRNTAFRLGMKPSDYAKMEDGEDNPDVILDALVRSLVERDEARQSLEHITEYGTEEINAAVELRQKLAIALLERDEAREELCHLRACVFDALSALEAGAFDELKKAWEEGA